MPRRELRQRFKEEDGIEQRADVDDSPERQILRRLLGAMEETGRRSLRSQDELSDSKISTLLLFGSLSQRAIFTPTPTRNTARHTTQLHQIIHIQAPRFIHESPNFHSCTYLREQTEIGQMENPFPHCSGGPLYPAGSTQNVTQMSLKRSHCVTDVTHVTSGSGVT